MSRYREGEFVGSEEELFQQSVRVWIDYLVWQF